MPPKVSIKIETRVSLEMKATPLRSLSDNKMSLVFLMSAPLCGKRTTVLSPILFQRVCECVCVAGAGDGGFRGGGKKLLSFSKLVAYFQYIPEVSMPEESKWMVRRCAFTPHYLHSDCYSVISSQKHIHIVPRPTLRVIHTHGLVSSTVPSTQDPLYAAAQPPSV